jgi:hypothetical protein
MAHITMATIITLDARYVVENKNKRNKTSRRKASTEANGVSCTPNVSSNPRALYCMYVCTTGYVFSHWRGLGQGYDSAFGTSANETHTSIEDVRIGPTLGVVMPSLQTDQSCSIVSHIQVSLEQMLACRSNWVALQLVVCVRV